MVAVVLTLLAAGSVAWVKADQSVPAVDAANGLYTLAMRDYSFAPSSLTWKVGQTVSVRLVNESTVRPGKEHELMVGKGFRLEPTPAGPTYGDGFEQDFFQGVEVRLTDATNVEMVMPGEGTLTGPDVDGLLMRMDPADMGDTSSGGMGDTSTGGMGGGAGMVMQGNGLMVVLKPGGEATLTFTVPDRPGTWTFACFAQIGQHARNGMTGTVQVV